LYLKQTKLATFLTIKVLCNETRITVIFVYLLIVDKHHIHKYNNAKF